CTAERSATCWRYQHLDRVRSGSRCSSGQESLTCQGGSAMDTHDDGYDLFRRAVVERDADAWATIAERYRRLLISWAVRCPAAQEAGEFSEDLADRALARAWAALSPERFAAFPSLAALLAYLRTCVAAAAIDAARTQGVHERAVHHAEQTDPLP